MQTIGIEYTRGIGYRIIENGVKLPMVFTTCEAATRHADLLKCSPLPTAEIKAVVAKHYRTEGDDELSRLASYYHP